MKKKYDDRSVLYTGDDMTRMLINNNRNDYDIDCSFCKFESNIDNICDDCSLSNFDDRIRGCSCHINAPCSFCENSKFEPSEYLINYKFYSKDGWKLRCFKSSKNVFNKLKKIESKGFELDAEILTTGETSLTITNINEVEIYEIELCKNKDFKQTMEKMILNFKIKRR